MAWELMNEPRCQADSQKEWLIIWFLLAKCYTQMTGLGSRNGKFVKSMDKNHLLEIGMEGFYGTPCPKRRTWEIQQDQGYSLSARDQYLSTVYQRMNNFESSGGGISGSLVWQLMAEGMDSYGDGYGIILSQDASTRGSESRSIPVRLGRVVYASSMAGTGPIPELD
ncbi:Mannan endo-1,4-beta-mannosidase 5 [Vitis vinifera]|uniref:Mannan endo-1,4-beta-mannosidase 5 n=1 Tax=Vitis vinifera TaxID=29760 RepID=A0A438FJD6_VITVI|nr:Mannan endo-1,4-beta-mannosidase 5 [Vitis vinifera]